MIFLAMAHHGVGDSDMLTTIVVVNACPCLDPNHGSALWEYIKPHASHTSVLLRGIDSWLHGAIPRAPGSPEWAFSLVLANSPAHGSFLLTMG